MKTEYSRYYCLNSSGIEVFTDTTTLNRKADNFHHSVFIESNFFDNFQDDPNTDQLQGTLGIVNSKRDSEFKYLIEELDKFLREKRKPFLEMSSQKIIDEFEEEGVFPSYNLDNPWDRSRRDELYQLVRELYQVEPRLYVALNIEQKKTFVRFLDLIMDSGERDRLFEVLNGIVELEVGEREELANLLKRSSMSRIVKTIKLIEDRYRAIECLKELVLNKQLRADEPNHVQKFIEKHYWVFGEQYHLVTAAEPKFEAALNRFVYYLRGEDANLSINHPDKQKEMDIFAVRQDKHNDTIHNIVVELKNPRIHLGQKELDQVKKYMRVILKQGEFNASNMNWTFYLVGNSFDTSGYIEDEIRNSQHHGEKHLVYKVDNRKIYVKKWSEIFAEFELKHDYLNKKLLLEREKLIGEGMSADDIVAQAGVNSAIQPEEMSTPAN